MIKKICCLILFCYATLSCTQNLESSFLSEKELETELCRLETQYKCGKLVVKSEFKQRMTISDIESIESKLREECFDKKKSRNFLSTKYLGQIVDLSVWRKEGTKEVIENGYVKYGTYEFKIETIGTEFDPIICTGQVEVSDYEGKSRSVLSNVMVRPTEMYWNSKMYVSILNGQEIGYNDIAAEIELKYIEDFGMVRQEYYGTYNLYIYDIYLGINMDFEAECYFG